MENNSELHISVKTNFGKELFSTIVCSTAIISLFKNIFENIKLQTYPEASLPH